jgi:peptidoglycan DL-endopeptidase CwlO
LSPWRPTAVRTLLALSLAAALTAPGLVPAFAAPAVSTPAIRAKQAEYDAAQTKMQDLADAAEQRVEEWNATVEALRVTREAIDANERDLQKATAALNEARGRLSDRADTIYRTGPVGPLELFLGTNTVEDFLSRMDLLAAIGRSDADLLARVREARFQVAAARAALEAREAEQVALKVQADERRKQVQRAYADQRTYVSSLSAEITKMIAAEEARQRRIAAERARQAKLAAERLAAMRKKGSTVVTGAGVSDVVAVALHFVGVAYVWGGSTPSGFDCSGLTQYAYAKCGISIPRTSLEQSRAGQHIPADRLDLLKPGDLVFFGTNGDLSRVHHVGIYCGDGQFLHAPASGDHVRVSSLTDRIAKRHDYVGASRF